METTVYLIKPESQANSPKIRAAITGYGLTIEERKFVELSQEVLQALFPDCCQGLKRILDLHLLGKQCEAGKVKGFHAVSQLLHACGEAKNPSECKPGTIRNLFGKPEPTRMNNLEYWFNGIYRPRTATEAERALKLFGFVK
jgi:nucleoside diphosphate kinase